MYEIVPFILPGIMLVIATGMVIYCWILDWRRIELEKQLKELLVRVANEKRETEK